MNVYIYTDGREPSGKTVCYYPFTDNQSDQTGNTTLSISGTKQTIGYQFTFNAGYGNVDYALNGVSKAPRFSSYWIKVNTPGAQYYVASYTNDKFKGAHYLSHNNSSYANKIVFWGTSSQLMSGPSTPSQWNHICFGGDGTTQFTFINGVKTNVPSYTPSTGNSHVNFCGGYRTGPVNFDISDFIIETEAWSDAEILDYYNSTKSLYGIS